MRNAIEYLLKLREELVVYASNGQVEIDNNLIENRIRPITLGRKNWLFAGSQNGAKKIAVMASLTGSAAMLGLDPYDYLHRLLGKLPTATDYELLTPLSYKRDPAQSS